MSSSSLPLVIYFIAGVIQITYLWQGGFQLLRLCGHLFEFRSGDWYFYMIFSTKREPGNVVGIATVHGLLGPGSDPGGGKIFRTCPDWPWGPPSLLYNESRVFPGAKSGRGVKPTSHPLLVPWSWKSRAIPLLPLWAVQPVQSLSARTRVNCTFS
jgi:hypothetical protein